MSDPITHECGIALIRLRKPLSYYAARYGNPLHAFNKLFLLMEKQHNRGQDGAGIGCVKLGMPKGMPYLFRDRSIQANPLSRIFRKQLNAFDDLVERRIIQRDDPEAIRRHFPYAGEILLGHMRYGTSGNYSKQACHPYIRESNWPTRTLMVAGNFNMTNTAELNRLQISRGQHPVFDTDTQTVLEEIGYHLDAEHTRVYREARDTGLSGSDVETALADKIDVGEILRKSAESWDGGYTIAGLSGGGDAFVLRDPHGIRPCHYFIDDEFIAFASERVPLMTVFEKDAACIQELEPGCAGLIRKNGMLQISRIREAEALTPCSFERIYFSRGNDPDIYQERKALGAALVPKILEMTGTDFAKTVFSFIPNTAETAYYGLIEGARKFRKNVVKDKILEAQGNGSLTPELIDELIIDNWPRSEKIAQKDIKLRTFISQEKGRSKLVSHVYDVTYGIVGEEDTLVILDDSIVRGTTLRTSILKILSRLNPRRIVIASTAPQIRYPDCYGIDMAELGKFIAFQAAVSLIKKQEHPEIIRDIYEACRKELANPDGCRENPVKRLYDSFTEAQISEEIARLVYPTDIRWRGRLDIVYQSIESLHEACPNHRGDWYFTGNYPTEGGYDIVNRAFMNFYENVEGRAYQETLPI